jgi:hypothetical protein
LISLRLNSSQGSQASLREEVNVLTSTEDTTRSRLSSLVERIS